MLISGGLLSERERIWPGAIQSATGKMTMCVKCFEMYRRMAIEGRALCGKCYPVWVESQSAIPYSQYTSSREV